jgi:hypothetical protein
LAVEESFFTQGEQFLSIRDQREKVGSPVVWGRADDETAAARNNISMESGRGGESRDSANTSKKVFKIAFGEIKSGILQRAEIKIDIGKLQHQIGKRHGGKEANLASRNKRSEDGGQIKKTHDFKGNTRVSG